MDYGSWSTEILPLDEGRSIASVLMEYDMTLYVRPYSDGYTKNYLSWNFETNTDPLISPVSTNDHADREAATVASGFGRIYIHSGKFAEGKKEYYLRKYLRIWSINDIAILYYIQ